MHGLRTDLMIWFFGTSNRMPIFLANLVDLYFTVLLGTPDASIGKLRFIYRLFLQGWFRTSWSFWALHFNTCGAHLVNNFSWKGPVSLRTINFKLSVWRSSIVTSGWGGIQRRTSKRNFNLRGRRFWTRTSPWRNFHFSTSSNIVKNFWLLPKALVAWFEETNRRLNFRMNHPMFSTSCVDNSLLFSNVKKADGNLLENFSQQKYFGTSVTWTLEGDDVKLHFVFVHERRLTFHVHLCHFAVQSLKIHFRYFAQMFVSLQLWTFEWNFIERRFQAQWFETSNAAWILHLWAQLWRKTSTPFSTFLLWRKLQVDVQANFICQDLQLQNSFQVFLHHFFWFSLSTHKTFDVLLNFTASTITTFGINFLSLWIENFRNSCFKFLNFS